MVVLDAWLGQLLQLLPPSSSSLLPPFSLFADDSVLIMSDMRSPTEGADKPPFGVVEEQR